MLVLDTAKRGRPAHPDILTLREWGVLEHLRKGLSNDEIAERLAIGLENRHDAARWATLQSRPA